MSLGRLKLNSESVSYITESLFAMLLEPNTNVKKALEIGLRPAKKENSIDSINIHQNVESLGNFALVIFTFQFHEHHWETK